MRLISGNLFVMRIVLMCYFKRNFNFFVLQRPDHGICHFPTFGWQCCRAVKAPSSADVSENRGLGCHFKSYPIYRIKGSSSQAEFSSSFRTVYWTILENYGYVNVCIVASSRFIQGGSNMTGTDLCVNKLHCAAAVRPWESEAITSTLPPARVRTCSVLSGSC